MKVTFNIDDLYYFEAWSGAISTKDKIINAGLGEEFMTNLEEHYPDGIDDIELNNLLWFDEEFCLHLVGLKTDKEEADEHDPQK